MKIQSHNIYYKPISYSPLRTNGAKISFCSNAEASDLYRNAKIQQQKTRQQAKNQRIIALASAIGLVISGAAGAVVSFLTPEKPDASDFEMPPSTAGKPFDNDSDDHLGILSEGNTQQTTEPAPTIKETIPVETEVETVPETTIPVTEETIPETTVEETEPENTEITEENGNSIPPQIEKIFADNPKVETQYNKIIKSLETFSEHLGEDGLNVIKSSVEKNGGGVVDAIDVLKILFIESNGRIYNKYGKILKSDAGAYGALQITKPTEEYINDYFGLTGTENELDVKNPYENVDACVYLLRFLTNKRGGEIERGKWLPTGDDLKAAVAWSYHDGAWAESVSNYGYDYIQKFKALSIIDEYPEVVEYILNGGE